MTDATSAREREYIDEINAAKKAVRMAARICRRVQADLVNAETVEKKDRSPVTVADYASQAMICAELERVFPEDLVVGEEGTGELREPGQTKIREGVTRHVVEGLGVDASEQQVLEWIDRGAANPEPGQRFWTLDPIDGTKGFLRGQHYAIALALIEDGQVVLGALGCPNLPSDLAQEPGTMMLAVRGQGAAQMPIWDESQIQAIQASDIRDAAEARFVESVESAHSKHSDSAQIAERLGIAAEPFRVDSQVKYAAVARGDASIYLRLPTRKDYEEKIWDHAAGSIVVEEAGGKVTDVTGQLLDFSLGRTLKNNSGIVSTNSRIHAPVIEAVRAVLGV